VSVSGLPSDRFLFVGFLPSRAGARRTSLAELAERRETLVVYESPLRVRAALADMLDVLGDREAFLCREATKLHEEYRRGRISELAAHLEDRERVRGEIVLVIGGATAEAAATTEPVEAIVARLIAAGKPRRQAVKEAARLTGLPAREVYRRSLETGE
jgi:16S rRNA (cytidine1402-2'-O)-methyltransferase